MATLGLPFKSTEPGWPARMSAPEIGEHNVEVFGTLLGLQPKEIEG
jgi:hypothetical protein